VRRECQGTYCPSKSVEAEDLAPLGHVPKPDASVLACRSKHRAVGCKAETPNCRRVAAKRMLTAFPAQPPEVKPFETAQVFLTLAGPLPLQRFPRPGKMAVLPGVVGRDQVRTIEQPACHLRLLFCTPALIFCTPTFQPQFLVRVPDQGAA